MTHDEFKRDWNKKHKDAFSDLNKVLAKHSLAGIVTGLTLKVPESVLTTAGDADDCSSSFKKPPCDPGEQEQICTCVEGNEVKVFKCCQ